MPDFFLSGEAHLLEIPDVQEPIICWASKNRCSVWTPLIQKRQQFQQFQRNLLLFHINTSQYSRSASPLVHFASEATDGIKIPFRNRHFKRPVRKEPLLCVLETSRLGSPGHWRRASDDRTAWLTHLLSWSRQKPLSHVIPARKKVPNPESVIFRVAEWCAGNKSWKHEQVQAAVHTKWPKWSGKYTQLEGGFRCVYSNPQSADLRHAPFLPEEEEKKEMAIRWSRFLVCPNDSIVKTSDTERTSKWFARSHQKGT